MNEYTIFHILTVFLSTQIIRTYLDAFHNRRKTSYRWKWLAWGIYILFQCMVIDSNAGHPLIILGINIILILWIYKSSYKVSNKIAIFLSGIFYVFWMLVEVAANDILRLTVADEYSSFFMLGNVVSKIVMYIFVQLLKYYRKCNLYTETPFRYGIKLFLVPVATIYIIHNNYYITSQYGDNTFFHITTVLMLLINYVMFDVYDILGKQSDIEKRNLAYEQQIALCNKQALEREIAYQETKSVRHNLNEYLINLESLLRDSKYKEAEAKINSILEQNKIYKKDVSRSGNLVIDSLINYKYSLAQSEKIDVTCYTFVPEQLPFDGADLCIILGNLMENAMEAVSKLPIGKRHMEIAIAQIKGSLSIVIQNPYKGEIKRKDGRMQTSKPDYKNHGIGLISVQRTVDKYNGELLISDTGNIFKVTVLLYPPEKSHE